MLFFVLALSVIIAETESRHHAPNGSSRKLAEGESTNAFNGARPIARRLLGSSIKDQQSFKDCESNPNGCLSLAMSNQQITGTVPTELGLFTNLTKLDLFGNLLVGTLPTELGKLNLVTDFWLDANNLTGTLPTELGLLDSVEWLALHTNMFVGTIPTELGNLVKLTTLKLYSNQLFGALPDEFANLVLISQLMVENNVELCGYNPVTWGTTTLSGTNIGKYLCEGCVEDSE
eukprot:CAMPEP_0196572258 /NCGR_PEP_ID=MMETSP1081-20130531/2337_1 /TAXON_ID=36882 /ORGANISM="Pyramimonas amylifera, Strain CCMP720" /LENGTH=231 /DNA_ID=CAMNT_0041889517 /DNA_START=150 /DNA_END=845 /DNA_ORIENTATION=+